MFGADQGSVQVAVKREQIVREPSAESPGTSSAVSNTAEKEQAQELSVSEAGGVAADENPTLAAESSSGSEGGAPASRRESAHPEATGEIVLPSAGGSGSASGAEPVLPSSPSAAPRSSAAPSPSGHPSPKTTEALPNDNASPAHAAAPSALPTPVSSLSPTTAGARREVPLPRRKLKVSDAPRVAEPLNAGFVFRSVEPQGLPEIFGGVAADALFQAERPMPGPPMPEPAAPDALLQAEPEMPESPVSEPVENRDVDTPMSNVDEGESRSGASTSKKRRRSCTGSSRDREPDVKENDSTKRRASKRLRAVDGDGLLPANAKKGPPKSKRAGKAAATAVSEKDFLKMTRSLVLPGEEVVWGPNRLEVSVWA